MNKTNQDINIIQAPFPGITMSPDGCGCTVRCPEYKGGITVICEHFVEVPHP